LGLIPGEFSAARSLAPARRYEHGDENVVNVPRSEYQPFTRRLSGDA
jgi:hypothetical protein